MLKQLVLWQSRRQTMTEEKRGERQKGVARIRSKERLSKSRERNTETKA